MGSVEDLFVQEITKVDDGVMEYGLACHSLVATLHLGGALSLGSMIKFTTRTILFLTIIIQDVKLARIGLVTLWTILLKDVAMSVWGEVSHVSTKYLSVHFTDILFLDS